MQISKDDVARKLAASHYDTETGITDIYRLVADAVDESRDDEPIKLLEVDRDTIPAGVEPLYFGPHANSGILFPSIIIVVTPDEFDRIQDGTLALPHNGHMGSRLERGAGVADN